MITSSDEKFKPLHGAWLEKEQIKKIMCKRFKILQTYQNNLFKTTEKSQLNKYQNYWIILKNVIR